MQKTRMESYEASAVSSLNQVDISFQSCSLRLARNSLFVFLQTVLPSCLTQTAEALDELCHAFSHKTRTAV